MSGVVFSAHTTAILFRRLSSCPQPLEAAGMHRPLCALCQHVLVRVLPPSPTLLASVCTMKGKLKSGGDKTGEYKLHFFSFRVRPGASRWENTCCRWLRWVSRSLEYTTMSSIYTKQTLPITSWQHDGHESLKGGSCICKPERKMQELVLIVFGDKSYFCDAFWPHLPVPTPHVLHPPEFHGPAAGKAI